MSNINEKLKYHIRFKGRILGPYTVKQLATLRDKGQLTPSLEVSTDGATWQPAATVTEVFPAAVRADFVATTGGKFTNTSNDAPVDVLEGSQAVWHYSSDDRQLGPVTQNEIQELLYTGRLTPLDLVWKEGMSDWVAVGDHPDFHTVTSQKHRLSRNEKKATLNQGVSANSRKASHFLDRLIDQIRRTDIAENSRPGSDVAIEVGKYASYATIALIFSTHAGFAVKTGRIEHLLVGLMYGTLGLALQFAAIKCCIALASLMRASKHRISSTALLDSIAVILMGFGVIVLFGSTLIAVEFHEGVESNSSFVKYPMMLAGLAISIVIIRGASLMLNPGWAGITVTEDAGSGENAIANIYFVILAPLFFVSSLFVVGAILGLIASGVGFVYLLSQKTVRLTMIQDQITFDKAFVGITSIPIVTYVYFLCAYIAIDFVRSILILPDRIDRLGSRLSQGNSNAENGSPVDSSSKA